MSDDPKKVNGLEVLEKFTGIAKGEIKTIWEQVKANQKKLEACDYHDFGPPQPQSNARYTCSYCGGQVNAEARHWYELGQEHGYNCKKDDPK